VPGRKQDDSTIHPAKPGWYPDPWSADGKGERYFDGKKWGTSERPISREATVTHIRPRTAARRRVRPYAPVLIFIAAVLAVWGIGRLRQGGGHGTTIVTTPPPTEHVSPRPPAGVGEAAAPLGRPAPLPAATGSYSVIRHQPDEPTVPVAFDPCRPIHYVVNSAGAPPDGAALIRSAIARAQTATGLHFVADGTTTEAPSTDRAAYEPARYPGRWAPVLIAWSNGRAFAPLDGTVDGVGQAVAAEADPNTWAYASGQVVLDQNKLAPAQLGDRTVARAVILHELGHLVGLDHTTDPRQLMYSESQFGVTDYGAGDLRGLAVLGTQACYPNL
jgi:hypothetical protein